jgi:type II secretory pathway component GspD/PulD (secretin)
VILSGSVADVVRAQRLLADVDIATPPAPPASLTVAPANIAAGALADVLRRAVPGLTVEVQGNTAILTGPQETINRAREIIASVDTPAGAGRRLEIYDVKYSSASSLAAMLTATLPGLQATPSAEPYAPPPATLQTVGIGGGGLGGSGGGSGGGLGGGGGGSQNSSNNQNAAGAGSGLGTTAVTSPRSRSLIIIGRDADVDAALRLLRAVDIAPTQVEIEARIVNVSLDNTLDLGVEWGGNAGPYASNVTVQEQDIRDIFRFGRFARTNLQSFSATLRYLETKGRSKTLANPRISVIDNEEASIFIGEVRRFPVTGLASTAADQTFIVQVEEVPVGVALLVRPRVNDETGEITMNIKPAVSTVTGFVQGIPQTATREASTTLRARDGETIVIGGLISDQESKSLQQVPLLGQIPIIGELFRRRINARTRSEVILFLTPRLLRNNGAAEAGAIQERLPNDLKAQPLVPRGTTRP